MKRRMNIELADFEKACLMLANATHPPARPGGRLALSLLLAGASLPRRRFAPCTRPNAPADASNSGF
jgi:hypothetical protein